MNLATKQVVNGLVERLANDVPAGDFESAEDGDQRMVWMLGVAAGIDVAPHGLYLERIMAFHVAFGNVFYELSYAVGTERDTVNFAESLYSGVGSQLQEHPVRPTVMRRGVLDDICFQVGNLHCAKGSLGMVISELRIWNCALYTRNALRSLSQMTTDVKNQAVAVSLGLVPYGEAWDIQLRMHEEVANGLRPDTMLLVEHPHVYTLGRRGQEDDILVDSAELARLGVEVHHTDRGGEVTYHGPGQLVGYPILNLRRWGGGPLKYVRALERVLIETLAEFGVGAESEGCPTGVWVEDRKVAAIGVKVSRRVTTHGFALNVCPDLSYFDHIVPCGMPESRVTSLSLELGREVTVGEVAAVLVERFGSVFGLRME